MESTEEPVQSIEDLVQILNYQQKLIEGLEKRTESNEMVNAQLLQAYMEMAARVEAILEVMAHGTEEERKQLQQALAASRSSYLDALKKATEFDG